MSFGSSQSGPSTAGCLKTSSEISAPVPDLVGHLDSTHDVAANVQLENLRKLSFKLNTSGSFRYVVDPSRRQNSDQRRQLRVAVLTVQAVLRFDHRLRPPKAYFWYEDPITSETMCDPVKCDDGRTYDRWTIIDNRSMTRSPFTRSPLAIAVDDINVRSWLFQSFPEQEAKFRTKRSTYRAKALQHLRYRPLDFKRAVEMLTNVLQWAAQDIECQDELDKILSYISGQTCHLHSLPGEGDILVYDYNGADAIAGGSQTSTIPMLRRRLAQGRERSQSPIPVIRHEDLIRERYGERRCPILLCLFFFFGVWICFDNDSD